MSYPVPLAAVALGVMWAGLAYHVSEPVDERRYLRAALQATTSAHDGAGTAALVFQQVQDGRVTSAFATMAYDDARTDLAAAQRLLAETPPPDDASRRLRDRLAPLVQAAVRDVGSAAEAEHAERLGDLIEQYR